MRIFQNKFFLICLCVAVVLSAVPMTFSAMGFPLIARNILGTLTLPFRAAAHSVANAFDGFGSYFQTLDALSAQNDSLREQNDSLSAENRQIAILEAENLRLKSYLGILSDHPDFTLEEAVIISREGNQISSLLTLNRGSFHGVSVNMAVITSSGIVGCVTEVGFNWCKVTPLTEPVSSVGAYVPRSGASGIVSGDYSLQNDGLCKLSYAEENADLQIGDTVCSSGIGSVYPPDLTVGTVQNIEKDAFSRTVTATVKPAVDVSNLTHVLIVTSWMPPDGGVG